MKAPLRFVMALVCGVMFFTSCMKEEDKELLRHPIHIQGTIDPTLGIPIGYGEVNIHDVLRMLNDDYTGILDTTGDVVSICYKGSLDSVLGGRNTTGNTTKGLTINKAKGGVLWSKDTTLTYSMDIDYFNKIDQFFGDTTEVYFNNLLINFDASVLGHAAPEAVETLRRYVTASLDSVRISYVDHQNVRHTYHNSDIEAVELDIEDIVEGASESWENLDLSDIVNALPKKLIFTFRFKMMVDRTILLPEPNTISFGELMDSLKVASMDYHLGVDAHFPCNFYFENMPYTVDLDLGEGLQQFNFDSIINNIHSGINSEIQESELNLEFSNGLPLGFVVSAEVLDAQGATLFSLVNGANIPAAMADKLLQPGIHTVSTAKKSTTSISIDEEKLLKLRNARAIHLKALVSTSNNVPSGETVAIRKDNFLGIRAYLKLSPKVSIDIPLTQKGFIK